MSRVRKDGTLAAVTCRYHCTSCGEHFSSLVAFDHHRVGSFDDGSRRCEYPEDAVSARGRRLIGAQTHDGVCRLLSSGERSGVTVWEAA